MSTGDWHIYDESTTLNYDFDEDYSSTYSNGDNLDKVGTEGEHWNVDDTGQNEPYGAMPIINITELNSRVGGLSDFAPLSGSDYLGWMSCQTDDAETWYGTAYDTSANVSDSISLAPTSYEFEMWFAPLCTGDFGSQTSTAGYGIEFTVSANTSAWVLKLLMGHKCRQYLGDWLTEWQDSFIFRVDGVDYEIWNKNVDLWFTNSESCGTDATDELDDWHGTLSNGASGTEDPTWWGVKVRILSGGYYYVSIKEGEGGSWGLALSGQHDNLDVAVTNITFAGGGVSIKYGDSHYNDGQLFIGGMSLGSIPVDDYDISEFEFTRELGEIGSGQIIINKKDIDFSDYYNLQETRFRIEDPEGMIKFYGRFADPTHVDDTVTIPFEEITGELRDRISKRSGILETGILTGVTATELIDNAKSWSIDEWNGFGVMTFASIKPYYVSNMVTDHNTGTIEWVGTSIYTYQGRGIGLDVYADDGSGTYGEGELPCQLKKNPLWGNSKPLTTNTVLNLLTTEAVSSDWKECLRIWKAGTYDYGSMHPMFDAYIDVVEMPTADIIGITFHVQAAVHHADQTTGIGVYIADIKSEDTGEIDTFLELTQQDGSSRITTVDTGKAGIWGVFGETFGLYGNSYGYKELPSGKTWNDYIWTRKIYDGGSGPSGHTQKVLRIQVKGLDDINTLVGHGMNIGSIWIYIIRLGKDINGYTITDTLPPSKVTVSTDPTSTVAVRDNYLFCQSTKQVFADFNDSDYGSSTYSFYFSDTVADVDYIPTSFLGQYHINILRYICNYSEAKWWLDGNKLLHFADDADIADSGVLLTTTNLVPSRTTLSYPKRFIWKHCVVNGHPALNLSYIATSAYNHSTREEVINLPHSTFYAELKKLGDAFINRHGQRKPFLETVLDYDVEGVSDLELGTYATVTYATENSTQMNVQRYTVSWKAGRKAVVTLNLGDPKSPTPFKKRDKINELQKRISILESNVIYSDINSTVDRLIAISSGSTMEGNFLEQSGETELTADWDAGPFEIKTLKFESDIATGTAPFTIASTTVSTNLNADLWDGYQFVDYIDQAIKQASSPTFNDLTISTPSNIYALSHDSFADFDANEHKLEAAIDHDALTNFTSTEHFTMLDQDNMADDSNTKAATQQSIKAYVDAQTHEPTLTNEQVCDFVGAMVTGNTETFIVVTYQDDDNTLDFVVPVKDEDNMASDSNVFLATQQSIKAYIDGQTHDPALTEEQVTDYAGGMFTGNTETFITATFQDGDNTIDLVVPVKDEDDMASDSVVHLATQQSIKKYVDDNAGQLTEEEVQDYVGAMVTGNSESFITVTYQDGDGTLDFQVPVLDEDDLSSDSDTFLATQQSIKKYVDDSISAAGGGDLLANGSIPMTANWDMGNYEITAKNFHTDTAGSIFYDIALQSNTDLGAIEVTAKMFHADTLGSTFVGLSITNELDMTGTDVWIDLNPSSTGSKTIISIIPSAAIGGSANWRGIHIDGGALDPTGALALIYGVNIPFSGISMTNQPLIRGVSSVLPAAYNSADAIAGYFSGDGKVVRICDDDYAIHIDSGDSRFDGNVIMAGDLIPEANNTRDLGSDALEWKNLWVDGIGNIDSLKLATGATITAFDNTPLVGSVTKVPTNTTVKVYVDKHNMIGAVNSTWIPCIMWMWDPYNAGDLAGITVRNLGGTDIFIVFRLPIPCDLAGLGLQIDQIQIGLYDADGDDYINSIDIYTIDTYNTYTLHYTDPGNYSTPAEVPTEQDIDNIDCTGLKEVAVVVNCVNAGASGLDISYARLKCFYA